MSDRRKHRPVTGLLSRAAAALAELAAWSLLAGLVTVGDVGRISTAIPLGTERVGTVPIFNAWTIGWNARAWQQGPSGLAGYWHAPIFYPQRGTFAFSEAQPLSALVAPLFGVSGGGALAYNAYLMLLLGLNALLARRLFRDLGFGMIVSLCGAAMVLMLPFVHWQLGVLQLAAIFGPLAVIWSLVRFSRSGALGWCMAAGLWSGITYASCNHYGLFLSLLAPALLVLLGRRLLEWSSWPKLAAGGLLAAVVAGPIVWAQLTWLKPHAEPRSMELIVELSARPREYLAAPVSRFVPLPPLKLPDEPFRQPLKLGAGPLLYLLAIVGAAAGLCRRGRRLWTLFCLLLGTLAWLWSIGPQLELGSWSPYDWALGWYPGLKFVRSPFRFAVVVQLVCAFLAVEALQLTEWVAALLRAGRWAPLVPLALTAVALAETWPNAPRLLDLPRVEENREWIDWLRENTAEGAAVVCLPFPEGTSVDAYLPAVEWMYLGLWHRRPLVQGYSGFFPAQFRELKGPMRSFPREPSLTLLRQRNVRYAVVRSTAPQAPHASDDGSALRPVFIDRQAQVTIYSLGDD